MVFVGNMARYALGLPVVRDARPDDGFLDLCILPCRNPIQLIGHSWRTLRRKHIEYPDVIYTHVERVQVTSPTRIPVEIDGEATGWLPLDISTSPQAIRFKLPPRNTWK